MNSFFFWHEQNVGSFNKANTEPTIAEMVPTPQYVCKINNFCNNQNFYVIIIIIIILTLEDNLWNIQAHFASVPTIWPSPKKTLRNLFKKKGVGLMFAWIN